MIARDSRETRVQSFLAEFFRSRRNESKKGGTVSWEISPVFFIRIRRRDIVSEFPWKRWKILGTGTEDIGRSAEIFLVSKRKGDLLNSCREIRSFLAENGEFLGRRIGSYIFAIEFLFR